MYRSVELTTMNCGECGGTYAINERYRQQCYDKGTSWTCPYCECGWGYAANNGRHAALKRELREANNRADRHQVEAREQRQRATSISRSYQRVRDRVKNGVCPCCNRTFENLARHMKTKHPDYGEHQQLRAMRLAYGLTQVQLAGEVGVSASYVSLYERGMELPRSSKCLLDDWASEQCA